jgi:hypothetical protein
VILEGPLRVGNDFGLESPGPPVSKPSTGLGEGVEVFDDDGSCASIWALTDACDLISWRRFRMRFEVVARGPLGPGFNGFFA